ncbi:AraC family transcriptional regulator [Flagellimonas sp.]|uniref:AraC family transcriptional regulator n=1 Tax=Flagellimonas sp. TaxID=2058762 RepID=UPI003B5097C6
MKKYYLHKNDYTKLHFELKALAPYFQRNKEKASKPHRHSFFQILWFKNSGNHYIDYEVVKHPANTLFLINRNQVHYFCPDSNNEGYLFHFNDSFISNLSLELLSRFTISIFNEIGDPHIFLEEADAKIIECVSHDLLQELEKEKVNYKEIVIHQFISLLYHIERIKKNTVPFSVDTNSDFSKVVRFKQLIIENVDQNLGIQDYSDRLGMSSKNLTKLTKQHTSLTPANLIKELKILEAKRMLSSQNISVKEVAYSLGFDQPTYFTKFFKKEVSITPKQFQEQLL